MDISSLNWINENIPSEVPISAAVTLGLGVVILIGGYAYFASRYTRWKNEGIDGPEPNLLFGNLLPPFYLFPSSFRKKWTLPELDEMNYKRFGKIYGIYELSRPVLIVSELELVKNILVRDFNSFVNRRGGLVAGTIQKHFLLTMRGDDWRRTRNTISPSFTSGKMKQMLSLIDECTTILGQVMGEKATSGEDVDVKTVYGCYTMDVVARCAFATEINSQQKGENEFVKHALDNFHPRKMMMRILAKITLPRFINIILDNRNDNIKYFAETVKSILDERRKQGYNRKYKDFLQILVESLKEDVHSSNNEVPDAEAHHGHENTDLKANGFSIDERKKNLTDDELVANAILFILAGYETTATLLTYATYALAMNPDKQEKLREEVLKAYESAGKTIEYETISTLKYLDSTICEALRLYSPTLAVEREATEPYKLQLSNEKVIQLNVGDIVRVPTWAIMHDAEYYPEPEKFEPERFLPENRDKLVPYSYLPFGAGPRNCIGMRFALLEAKIALFRLMTEYRFVKSPKTPEKPDYSRASFLLTPKDIFVKVQKL